MVNVAELETTMQEIVDDPDSWDQMHWICGTTACFAGKVARNHGCTVVASDFKDEYLWSQVDIDGLGVHHYTDQVVISPSGERVTVREFAQEVCDLTGAQAHLLFHSANSLDSLQHVVKGLINGDSVEFIKEGTAQ